MKLHYINPQLKDSTKNRKRIGRGTGSGKRRDFQQEVIKGA